MDNERGALVAPDWRPNRAELKDSAGKLLTQGLFLEYEYNPDRAIYTFKDEDYEYKGKVFPSARRLYLATNDPTGYVFATTYLWGWDHWKQIRANKTLQVEIAKWEEEMEVKLRAAAAAGMLASAREGSGSAAKWIADGKWHESKAGRPPKGRQVVNRKVQERAQKDEAAEDARRLGIIPGGKA